MMQNLEISHKMLASKQASKQASKYNSIIEIGQAETLGRGMSLLGGSECSRQAGIFLYPYSNSI